MCRRKVMYWCAWEVTIFLFLNSPIRNHEKLNNVLMDAASSVIQKEYKMFCLNLLNKFHSCEWTAMMFLQLGGQPFPQRFFIFCTVHKNTKRGRVMLAQTYTVWSTHPVQRKFLIILIYQVWYGIYSLCYDLMKTQKQVGTDMHFIMLVKFFHTSFCAHFLLCKEKPPVFWEIWPFSHLSTEINSSF